MSGNHGGWSQSTHSIIWFEDPSLFRPGRGCTFVRQAVQDCGNCQRCQNQCAVCWFRRCPHRTLTRFPPFDGEMTEKLVLFTFAWLICVLFSNFTPRFPLLWGTLGSEVSYDPLYYKYLSFLGFRVPSISFFHFISYLFLALCLVAHLKSYIRTNNFFHIRFRAQMWMKPKWWLVLLAWKWVFKDMFILQMTWCKKKKGLNPFFTFIDRFFLWTIWMRRPGWQWSWATL